MATAPGNTSFSITLPDEIIDSIMFLQHCKLFGTNRGEIARGLILDMFKRPEIRALVDEGRAKSLAAK